MNVVVFAGPTIAAVDVQRHLGAEVRPPVAQGDVHRAVRNGARAIGIVDGYFDRVPAVWHKEILWALSAGVAVYGSASMGALRAAELAEYGMVGVGAVFEAFRSGELEDDDEVAVAHAAEEFAYRPLSEALVNVRATVASALENGVLTEPTAKALVAVGKQMFYADRTFPALLARGRDAGLPLEELSELRAWLEDGRINQKRFDAVQMLLRMQADLATGCAPPSAPFHFEHTDAWDVASREAEGLLAGTGQAAVAAEGADELEASLREELQLFSPYALIRAVRKREALAQQERAAMPCQDEVRRAVEWYFRTRLDRTVPENLDELARELGMVDARTFGRAAWREYIFVGGDKEPDEARARGRC